MAKGTSVDASVSVFFLFVIVTVAGQHSTNSTTNGSPTTRPPRTYNVSDDALRQISSQLYALDVNGAYGRVQLDLQNRINSSGSGANRTDAALKPLFKSGIPTDLASRPTYARLIALFDNYLANVSEVEQVTNQELAEEVAFLDALMATRVMQATHQFLHSKGLADSRSAAFKDYLRTIWFGLYSRAANKKGSSGFEHVFLGEWKNGISGLHSWIRYSLEESRGNMNYLGYIKTLPIGQSPVGLIELPMEWKGVYKPISTMATSSSPELDIALYTICFLTRPDAACPVQGPLPPSAPGRTNSRNTRAPRYRIQTHTNVYQGRKYIGSAYPSF